MKKLLLLIAVVLFSATSFAQKPHQLTGHFDNLPSDTIYAILINKEFTGAERRDTIIAHDGTFYYDIEGTDARMVNLAPKVARGASRENMRNINFVMNPNECGMISGTFRNFKFSGSPYYDALGEYFSNEQLLNEQIANIRKEMEEAKIVQGANVDELETVATSRQRQLQIENRKWRMDFIKAHADEDVAAALLRKVGAANVLPLLTDRVKKGPMALYVKAAQIDFEQRQQRETARAAIQPGKPAPVFTLKDINGNDFTLTSLRGKYVILDFWGSWCGWCIKGFPDMIVAYKQYKDKLEIVGIDCNDTEDKWKAAVKQYELPWLHVYNPRSSNDLTTVYGVSGYPTKVLISPEGNIIRTFLGESDDFYIELEKILK